MTDLDRKQILIEKYNRLKDGLKNERDENCFINCVERLYYLTGDKKYEREASELRCKVFFRLIDKFENICL